VLVKLVILVVLLWLAWRALKQMILPPPGARPRMNRPAGEIDDVMVKDPQCQVYIPMRHAVQARTEGGTLYFCSEKCRDEYFRSRGGQ